jgi:hypothetical protein
LLAKKVLVAAVCVTSLLSLVHAIPSSAQGQNPIISVVSGKSTTYNINTTGTPPQKFYTSSPPLMLAEKIGSGGVVAAGIASTCRDNNWNNPNNPDPYLDVLLDKAFQWMKPGATKVLWYEGYGVYNTMFTSPVKCGNLLTALEAKGYTVTGSTVTPITSSLLSGHDILVIPQLELGDASTGGNPNLLPDNSVQAIVNFVEGGGGLLIMEQSDYAGHNYTLVQNKILNALGVGFYFQDDQVEDDANKWGGAAYQPIANIDTTTAIGSAAGKSEIGLDDICSLRIQENYDVSVVLSPTVGSGTAGTSLAFTATITNIGINGDTYNITVGDVYGWSLSLSENQITLENGESADDNLTVTVPSDLTTKLVDNVTVYVSGVAGGESENTGVRAINIFPKSSPPYPIVDPSVTHFLGPGLPDLLVSLPAVPIITGTAAGYSLDTTPRAPWPILYGEGEFPPMAAAAFVGQGRVVATNNALLRDKYFPQVVLSNEQVMSDIVRWMENWNDPKGDKFLYFVTEAALGTYHLPSIVSTYLGMLGSLGFDVTTQVGGVITASELENVSILNIAEVTGRALSADEIQAVTNFVNNGGNLILMCQSDYGGYGEPDYVNALLQGMNVPISFQDDEVYDDNNWVIDGPWYPQVYLLDPRSVNPNFDVFFPAYEFSAVMPTQSLTANNVQVLLPFTITNTGSRSSSYKVDVQETSQPIVGWTTNFSPTGVVSIAAGENIEGYVTINVPSVSGIERMNLVLTATDQNQTFLTDNITFAILGDNSAKITPASYSNGQTVSSAQFGSVTIEDHGYSGGGVWTYVVQTSSGQTVLATESQLSGGVKPSSKFPVWIIAVVIVVIVIVVAGGYFAMRKKSGPAKGQ